VEKEENKRLERQELINFLRKDLNLIPEDFAGYYAKGWFFLDSNKFKKVLVEELHKTFHDVWDNKNDLYILNFGREGSGKSLFSLWLTYEIFKKDNRDFDILNNVVFDHPEWVLRQISLKKDILVYDEAEDTFNTMKFQTGEGREGMKIAIRNRAQNIINILNFPSFRYLHPYIREERMDLLFLNLNYVYHVGNERKRVFIKAIYDKEDAVRILSEMSNTTFIDKKRIFRYKKGGKNVLKFKPKIAGIFLLDEELKNPEFQKILKFYEFKKSETMDLTKVETLLNNVFKKERFYLLVKMIQEMPSFIVLLFKTLYKMIFQYKVTTMAYNFNFENKNKKEKEKNTLKEKSFYIIPERFFLVLFPKEIWTLIAEKLVKFEVFERVVYLNKLKNEFGLTINFHDRGLFLKKEDLFILRSIINADYNNVTTLDTYIAYRLLMLGKTKSKREIYEKMIKSEENKEKIKHVFRDVEKVLDTLFDPTERTFGNILIGSIKEAKEKYPFLDNIIQYLVDIHHFCFSEEKINLQKIDNDILQI
jgi:hypothetical protein